VSGPQDDAGDDVLAKNRVGHAEHRHLVHGGVERNRVLDVGGVHVVAAPYDHVLAPAHDVQVTVLVDPAKVPGHESPVDPGAGRRLGVFVVLAGSARDPHADLADLAGRDGPAVGSRTDDLGGR
jgi:hypothetical protein